MSVEADISSFYQELQFFWTDEGSPAPSFFYSSYYYLLICFSFLWQSSLFHPLLHSSVCQGYPVFCFEDDEGDLIADTYLTEGTSWFLDPFAENFITHTMPLQETCVEILVRYPDDWGNIPNTFSFYNCMGRCGISCVGAWAGRGLDCLKHDVCSYFEGLAMETPVVGFCRGIDFGDETAQSVAKQLLES